MKSSSGIKIVLSTLGLGIILFGGNWIASRTPQEFVSPLPLATFPVVTLRPTEVDATGTPYPTKRPSGLSAVIQKSLSGTKGTYAVVVKNLKTGERYAQNEHTVFETASLYKLWVMAVVYDFISQEKLTKDQKLSQSVQSLNGVFDIHPGDAELTQGYVSFTVKEALEQMITISHNYAALLLSYTIKNSSLNAFLHREALDESKTGEPPQSTASDIALFYEKLYKGKVVNAQLDQEMLDLLARQKLNDRIPKYLPDNVKVAHKTGEIGGYKHDAGIVFSGEDYIVVVMSKTANPQVAAEREALLSKAVYDYFGDW